MNYRVRIPGNEKECVTHTVKYELPKTISGNPERWGPCTIALGLTREGKYYHLRISDNGIGIPERMDVAPIRSPGLHFIGFIVTHQMRGTIEVSPVNGTAYTIRFSEPDAREPKTDI